MEKTLAYGSGDLVPPNVEIPGNEEHGIIAHGPLIRRGLSNWHRPVLRLVGDEFVVHYQQFVHLDDLADGDCSFDDGEYAGNNFVKAYGLFADRIKKAVVLAGRMTRPRKSMTGPTRVYD